jgi:nucleotide-binding universal stress UspA family protein
MTDALIVPLDGSDLSETAIAVAEQLGQGLELPITLLTSGWGSTVSDLSEHGLIRKAGLQAPVPVPYQQD